MKKFILIFSCLVILTGTLQSCVYNSTRDTLVISTQPFNGEFNPFYAESTYDQQILKQIFVCPQRLNENNEMIDWGGSISYEETRIGDETHIIYTVKINESMKFSDGAPVTIDDYLYSFYILADPSYKGPYSSFQTTSIIGLGEYYYDDENYLEQLADIEATVAAKYDADSISKEDFIAYLINTDLEGWWNGQPNGEAAEGYMWSDYIKDEGFSDSLNETDANDPDALLNLLAEIEYTNYVDSYNPASYYTRILAEDYISTNLSDGINVPDISGITRVDDYTCKIKFADIDIYGDRTINLPIVPSHYYGEFEKGQAEAAIMKYMTTPMGSGPYVFDSYIDGVVTCTSNSRYFEGKPYIQTVKWVEMSDGEILDAMKNGNVDIANPSVSDDIIDDYINAGLKYTLVDNNGYCCLSIDAAKVEKNVRRGFMNMLNRTQSVKDYFGQLASVIERPMPTTLAEYPLDATEYYGYDTGKALECFLAAGYDQINGELVKNGEKLTLNAYIGGSGVGDHPGFAMLVEAADDLQAMGGQLNIHDVSYTQLQTAIDDGSADVFVFAWGESNSCDKSSVYMSGGSQNLTHISNAELDDILVKINKTFDFDERRALVSEMLDIVMDEAVEMPLYQRKNMLVYNPAVIDMESLPKTTAYYSYASELWKLKLR